jgi:hypothetical protein
MKKFSFALIVLFGLLFLNLVKAQTVEDIIKKNIDAMGGKEKLQAVKSVQIESSLDMMGNEIHTTRYVVDGKAFKSEFEINGQKIIQCVTDTGSWGINPMLGQTTPEPLPLDIARVTRRIQMHVFPLLNYPSNGIKLKLEGRDSVNGVNAYKVRMTTPDSVNAVYYFDPSTYYVIKGTAYGKIGGQDVETTVLPSNYQKMDFGVFWPLTEQYTTTPPGVAFTFTNKKIDINKEIDPKIFIMH